MLTRRDALKQLALAGAGVSLLGTTRVQAKTEAKPSDAVHGFKPGFQLGVATVTLKALPLDNALAAVRRLGLQNISLHRAHLPWETTAAQWRDAAARIRTAGCEPRCCGVLYLKNDEPAMRRMFDYARALGVGLISCSPEPAALPLLEKLVKEYDLPAAIHNHGPEDKVWPAPSGIWRAIQSLDARLGLCLDIGHCYRAGEDPVAAIRQYGSRLLDVHLKDSLAAVGTADIPVEMGRGRIDLHGVLAALGAIGFNRNAWFEYEKDPSDPVPGLSESVGYLRGLMKGMDTA
jgi:inosose dehydratase